MVVPLIISSSHWHHIFVSSRGGEAPRTQLFALLRQSKIKILIFDRFVLFSLVSSVFHRSDCVGLMHGLTDVVCLCENSGTPLSVAYTSLRTMSNKMPPNVSTQHSQRVTYARSGSCSVLQQCRLCVSINRSTTHV